MRIAHVATVSLTASASTYLNLQTAIFDILEFTIVVFVPGGAIFDILNLQPLLLFSDTQISTCLDLQSTESQVLELWCLLPGEGCTLPSETVLGASKMQ